MSDAMTMFRGCHGFWWRGLNADRDTAHHRWWCGLFVMWVSTIFAWLQPECCPKGSLWAMTGSMFLLASTSTNSITTHRIEQRRGAAARQGAAPGRGGIEGGVEFPVEPRAWLVPA